MVELATRLGVVEWISLGAIPAAVPHTRSVPILGTTSEPGRLRGDVQPGPAGLLRVPAAAVSVLEMAMAEAGIPAVGYFAQVPHYVSGPYPAASLELLEALGRHLGVDPADRRPRRGGPRPAHAAGHGDGPRGDDPDLRRAARRRWSTSSACPSGDDLIGEIERFLREGGTEGRLG